MRSTQPGSFSRRHYHSVTQLWNDLRRLARQRSRPRQALHPALRERLVLVVTAVNRCRYCAVFHSHIAQQSGLSAAEIAMLLDGSTQLVPAEEIPALLYARHWAEAAGKPTPTMQAQLEEQYGPKLAAAIERVLHTIWIGNLLGNTWDYLLFRLWAGQPEVGLRAGTPAASLKSRKGDSSVIDHFDLLAPLYDRLIGAPDPAQLRTLLDLPTAGRVLDAGGGTGRISAQLRLLAGDVVLVDSSLPMLREAQRKGLTPIQGDVARLPFPDASFERVVVVDALHHFPDQRAAIRELLRVLRPGGRLVIEEPDIGQRVVKLIALVERLALMGSHFASPTAIRDMISAEGGTASLSGDGCFAAWIVAEKAVS